MKRRNKGGGREKEVEGKRGKMKDGKQELRRRIRKREKRREEEGERDEKVKKGRGRKKGRVDKRGRGNGRRNVKKEGRRE